MGGTLLSYYKVYSYLASVSEEVRQQERYSPPETYKNAFLAWIDGEVDRLNREKSTRVRIESSRMELDALSRNIPDAAQQDRLLRYEATLTRNIDKTLNQIERLQRMRRGQPVPPPINVNVTAS